MAGHTFKLIEIVAVSSKSFSDAAANAVKKAAQSLHGISWFEVVEERGAVKDGGKIEYQVKLKVAFKLDD